MIELRKPGWSFYPAWIFLSALSVPIAFVLYFLLSRVLVTLLGDYVVVNGEQHITEDYYMSYFFVPLIGLVMGALQNTLLRRIFPHTKWWLPATFLGWSMGLLLVFGVRNVIVYFWSAEVYFASSTLDLNLVLLGLMVGVGQWLVLRRFLPKAGWWIVANLVGWGLVTLFTGRSLGQFGLIGLYILPAAATAVTLAWLLNQAAPGEPKFAGSQ